MVELFEKIQVETCWAITAKTLTRFNVLRAILMRHLLSKGEGITAPIMGWEKFEEINEKIMGDGGKKMFPIVKEMFNIPVENAVGAAKLYIVTGTLLAGPEDKSELVETTPERVIVRSTKCAYWERFKELELDPGLMVCPAGHQAFCEEGLKAVNPKLTCKLTKATPWGDPYCEDVIEFKEK